MNSFGHTYIVSTNGAFFRALDTNFVWFPISDGSSATNVQTIVFDEKNNAYAGTDKGVFVSYISSTGLHNYAQTYPSMFSFSQNYPNPFNPTTMIEYSLPKASHVKIVVFDMLAREVRTITNQQKSAGRYKVEFNANNLPSGVYFYQLQTNEFTETKKLLLIR